MAGVRLADTTFVANQGWTVQPGTLDTIVTRAPTHEPYPYHNRGVNVATNLNSQTTTTTPDTQSLAGQAFARVATTQVQAPLDAEAFVAETPAIQSVPPNQANT